MTEPCLNSFGSRAFQREAVLGDLQPHKHVWHGCWNGWLYEGDLRVRLLLRALGVAAGQGHLRHIAGILSVREITGSQYTRRRRRTCVAGEGTHEGRGDVHACMGSREIFVRGGAGERRQPARTSAASAGPAKAGVSASTCVLTPLHCGTDVVVLSLGLLSVFFRFAA